MSNEEWYIKKRMLGAKGLSFLFFIFRLFPIKKNKIVCSTFEGDGGFCCNPKFIIEELHKQNIKCDIVWLVKDKSKEFPNYIKAEKYTIWKIAYHLSTAQIWIDNYRKPLGTLKRKGQIYIQTWHASLGFKPVGLFRGDSFPRIARIVSEWDSNLIDYVLSNSDYCDKIYPQKLLYKGPTLRTGSPRVDCLINNREELYSLLRIKCKLKKDDKIILFAPTFRGGNQKDKKQVISKEVSLDFNILLNSLNRKFGGDWFVMLKLHPQLSAKIESMPIKECSTRIFDVSQWDDISTIMAGCDMVITDYSSCAFDAAFANIPVLLYADDIQEYTQDRGKLMWNLDELPFAIAETTEELIYNINCFNIKDYKERVKIFMSKNGINEDGCAARRVVDYINQYLDCDEIGEK